MFRILWRFRQHVRPHVPDLIAGVLLAVAEVGVTLAKPWPLRYLVDDVLAPESGVRPDDARSQALYAALALAGIVILASAISYGATRLLSVAGLRIANGLRVTVLAKLHRLPLQYHSQHHVGDLVSRTTSDVSYTQDMIVQVLSTMLPNVLLLIGMFGVMLALNPMFTLLAAIATPPLFAATRRSRVELRMAARRARKADGALASAATEDLGSIQLLQAFTLEPLRIAGFARLSQASLDAGSDSTKVQARFGPMVEVAGVASTAMVLWYGANLVIAEQLSLGVLLVFVSYLGAVYKPVKTLSKLSNVVSKGAAAAERIEDVLSTPAQIGDSAYSRPIRISGDISFQGVSFSYGREPVLDNIRLSIPSGANLALVGPTGAGKSTLVAMVPRLIEPTEGQVLIDGVDIRAHELAKLRSQIGMVLQDTALLEGTLRDNVLCGRPDATEAELQRAIRLALVDEFATRLPAGLDTPLGERGVGLSGGQRQRVAIARAILRDSSIIILDEPTSALDALSEELLIEALDNLPSGRTRIVIAHRLSTIRNADRIAVMNQGRIVEFGTHDELMTVGGLYHRLASFQSTARRLPELDAGALIG